MKSSKASHLVGGYISYEHISGNDYRIEVRVFNDCFGAVTNNPLTVCVRSASVNYNTTIQVLFDTTNFYPYHTCMGSAISCWQGGSIWAMSESVFTGFVTLPTAAEDWRFSVYLCCRNFVPTTVGPADPGIILSYFYATLDNLNVAFNSSPRFNSNLTPVFCIGVSSSRDFSTTDVDGDLLVYSLDSTFSRPQCISDSSITTQYLPPYSYLNFMDSSTPIVMDSSSGILSFTPSSIHSSVYSLRVDEYRNGIKVGSVHRSEEIIITNGATGVSSVQEKSDVFSLFPNPAGDLVWISFNKSAITHGKFEIRDLSGRLLVTGSLNAGNTLVDVSLLNAGVYVVFVENHFKKLLIY